MSNSILRLFCLFFVLSAALPACAQDKTCVNYGVKVLETLPHDRKAYTQGLFFHGGELFESTGGYGESSLRKLDLSSGKALVQKNFNRKYFGEGSCIVDGKLYVLTWTNKLAFVYDAESLEYKYSIGYAREGWGLTALPRKQDNGAVMVASDGSSNLYFLDDKLQTVGTLPVKLGNRPVRLLNELEWIDGRIWANVYTTDLIVIINPKNGQIEGRIDCSSLIPAAKRSPDMDVLNGIAIDEKGQIYLTGKNWPSRFRVELYRK